MTNREKYLKKDVDPSNLIEACIEYYYKHKEEEGDFGESFVKYMNEPATQKLTEDEKVILRNLHEEYKRIRRNEMGNLYIGVDYFGMYDNLFQFIKNGEEHSIEELLK